MNGAGMLGYKKHIIQSFIDNIKGTAAVEFALLFPPLVLMMVGAIDFGVYMNQKMKVENAARAAVEYVLQGGNINNITYDVLTAENLGLTEEEMENLDVDAAYVCECADGISLSCTSGADDLCPDEGDYLREFVDVSVTYVYETFAPYPGLPDEMNIVGNVRMHIP